MSSVVLANDVSQYKGAKKNIEITVTEDTGSRDISNDKLTFYLYLDVTDTPVLTKDTDTPTDFEKIDATHGKATVHILPSETTNFLTGRYIYAVWIERNGDPNDLEPFLTGYYFIHIVGPNIVDRIRGELDVGAELGIKQIRDEVVAPTTVTSVYTLHRRIKEVQGVWLATDVNHALTNYYANGKFDYISGKLYLGTELPDIINDVRINYTWESGIKDEVIWHHLVASQVWIQEYTGGSFTYGATVTNLEKSLENAAIALAVIRCVLTINGGNVAQMGYNFRLGDFEVQTKLWGEGMIAQELFKLYLGELDRWLSTIGKYIRFKVARNVTRYSLGYQLMYLGQSIGGHLEGSF